MPRRVQDIVAGDRRSIRDVPLPKEAPAGKPAQPAAKGSPAREAPPKSREIPPKAPPAPAREKGEREIPIHRTHSEQMRRMPVTPPAAPRKPRRSKGKLVWILAIAGSIVVLAGAAFAASTYFSHATFTIAPKTIPVTVNGTYITQPAPGSPGTLGYELVPFDGSTSTTVPATDGPQVSVKAQGQVTLYNDYSSQPQRLIAGTRLSGSSGLLYLLTGSVLIPGDTSSGGSTVPGSVKATIIASQAGPSYNISGTDAVSDLKVVAFQGTPRYAGIYAQLASSISGGFTGAQKTVSPALLASTTAMLKAQIASSLAAQAMAAVPTGSIMYKGAYATVFAPSLVGGAASGQATVTVSGTLYAILFKQSDLVGILAPNQAALFSGFSYTTPGLDTLSFSIPNAASFSPAAKTPLIIRLQGPMSLVGTVPVDAIKAKLAGVSLASTENILEQYGPVIDIAHSSGELVPPWASGVPTDLSRISVVVQGQ